jgi:hypothetical protein
MTKIVISACHEFGDTVTPRRRPRQVMKMDMEDLKAIEDRLVARQHDLDRIFAQARTQGAMPIGGVSQLMDIIADMNIDLAAITIVPPGLRARIYAWLNGYHRELAASIIS